jgi:hypothetical protein
MKKKTKATRKQNKPVTLGNGPSAPWFKTENARPKTIVATLERTTDGYRVIESQVLVDINQHRTDVIRADARAFTRDLNQRGVYVL